MQIIISYTDGNAAFEQLAEHASVLEQAYHFVRSVGELESLSSIDRVKILRDTNGNRVGTVSVLDDSIR